ncbi:hypothetical protein NCPPB3778_22 [Rathayibacter phage NCPPB3778]|nr:hypothetical protein NCPPB3778_22 [Rathayibacter phage NCPPB3778]
MLSYLRRQLSRTIWSRPAIPSSEWRYRNLKRVLLPFVDFAFIVAGVSGALNEVPSLSEFYSDYFVDAMCWAFAVAGLVSFAGVIYPCLWRLEIAAKSLLLGALLSYEMAIFILAAWNGFGGSRVYIFALVLVPVALVTWRLTLLGAEWAERRRTGRPCP